jgi:hypothetical protein
VNKYELVQEPTETWMVFDTVRGQPAEERGNVLVGLDRDAAGLVLYRLNVGLLQARFLPSPDRPQSTHTLEGEAGIIKSNEM